MEKGLVTPSDPLLIALEDLYHEPLFQLYGRSRPVDLDEVMKCPEMRKMCVSVTTNNNALSQEDINEVYDELKDIYSRYYKDTD